MEKEIKIQIEVENDNYSIGHGRFLISAFLFSRINPEKKIDEKDLIKKTQRAIKKLEGYNTITITVTKGGKDKDGYTVYNDITSSVRVINTYGTTEISNLNGNKYDKWVNASKFAYKKLIKEHVDIANKEFSIIIYEIDNAKSINRENIINSLL